VDYRLGISQTISRKGRKLNFASFKSVEKHFWARSSEKDKNAQGFAVSSEGYSRSATLNKRTWPN
jgi:hypothetical protein